MKVLMFGWEFPPNNRGGLGTACYGLTKGLSKNNVDILFVLPKQCVDHDHINLIVTDLDYSTGTSVSFIQIYQVDENEPSINITSPQNGLYINNVHMKKSNLPIVWAIGPITIEIIAEDDTRVSQLNVTLDKVIISSSNDSYFLYYLSDIPSGFYSLNTKAKDIAGNIAMETRLIIVL